MIANHSRNWARVERILVALDASEQSLTALDTAAALAQAMKSELTGLFVEDAELLTLAELPFSTEVRHAGAQLHRLDAAEMEKEISNRLMSARQALERTGAQRQLRWRFHSVRGNVHREVAAAASHVDLLCIGCRSGSGYLKSRIGGTALRALQSNAPVLIAGSVKRPLSGPVAVIFDGSDDAKDCAGLAVATARQLKGDLVFLVTGPASDELSAVQHWIDTTVAQDVHCSITAVKGDDPLPVLKSAAEGRFGLIVCGMGEDGSVPSWLEHLTEVHGCALLLVPRRASK